MCSIQEVEQNSEQILRNLEDNIRKLINSVFLLKYKKHLDQKKQNISLLQKNF